jgi:2-dehydro-3-deoxygluconokinase
VGTVLAPNQAQDAMRGFDLVTFGEALLRLTVPLGDRLERATSLSVSTAGSEANVAIALARMGRRTAWFSCLPDSVLGRRVAAELDRHSVDVSEVRTVEGGRLGVYFVELARKPRPTTVLYDRSASTAARMSVDDVPWELVFSARILHMTGITAALSASCRDMVLAVADRARAERLPFSVDVNYRSRLWSAPEAGSTMRRLCQGAELLTLTIDDAREVFGMDVGPHDLLRRLQAELRVDNVIITRGSAGASWLLSETIGDTAAYEAEVLDRLGAGDAFTAGILLGWLEGDVRRGVEYGLAMAALMVGMSGDHFLLEPEDVRGVIEGGGREVVR